jgi:hypothetical protein
VAADAAAPVEAAVAAVAAEAPATAAAPDAAAAPVQEAAEAADAAKAVQSDRNARQPDRAYFVDGVKVSGGPACTTSAPRSSRLCPAAQHTLCRGACDLPVSGSAHCPHAACCLLQAIDVEVDYGQGPCRLVHVAVDVSGLQPSSKPFLGGFRHKQTGTTFHHASMQTVAQAGAQHSRAGLKQGAAAAAAAGAGAGSDEGGCCSLAKLTRETQTVKAASSSCQTVREAATQVAVPGLLLGCSGDRWAHGAHWEPPVDGSKTAATEQLTGCLAACAGSSNPPPSPACSLLQGVDATTVRDDCCG